MSSVAASLPPANRMLVPVSYYTRVWELFGHQSGPVLATVLSRRGSVLELKYMVEMEHVTLIVPCAC